MALLVAVLPFCVQTFAYVGDAPPLFALAKVWPLITLPVAVYAMLRLRLPYAALPFMLLAYATCVTPIIAMTTFGIDLPEAMFPTVKMWALLNYAGTAGMLALLRPTRDELRRALVWLGVATLAVLWMFWLVLPLAAYQYDPNISNLFLNDLERGPRIYAPMTLGFFLIFYLNRGLWLRPAVWKILALAFCVATLFIIYKEKLAIAVVGLLLVFGALSAFQKRATLFLGLGLFAAGVAAAAVLTIDPAKFARLLGGSLDVRIVTAGLALDYLDAEPWRWLFGVGAMTKHGGLGMDQFFRDPGFFLADIGWLGIMFEYGAIGCAMLLSVYYLALRLTLHGVRANDAFSGALLDSVLYVILTEVIYSATMSPGIIASMAAMALYASAPQALVAGRPSASRR